MSMNNPCGLVSDLQLSKEALRNIQNLAYSEETEP